jgi:hypothetical protein
MSKVKIAISCAGIAVLSLVGAACGSSSSHNASSGNGSLIQNNPGAPPSVVGLSEGDRGSLCMLAGQYGYDARGIYNMAHNLGHAYITYDQVVAALQTC